MKKTKTLIVKAGEKNLARLAAGFLRKGKTIIYPTETCYGIGADALSIKAVKKVHWAKKQEFSKPISIIVPSLNVARKFCKLDSKALKLAKAFMPGPLTLIVEKKPEVPEILSGKKIAFRISSNPTAQAIAKAFNSGITATSANIHGEKEIYDGTEVVEKFSGIADLIINTGLMPERKPSTIFDTVESKILRIGKISLEELQDALA